MGKMKGDIYKYYMLKYDANDPANSNPRLPKWECRFCSKQYVQNATKMRHHVLNMCGEIPAPLKLALLDIPNVNVHEDSNDETKAYLSSLGIGQPSSDPITTTVVMTTASSSSPLSHASSSSSTNTSPGSHSQSKLPKKIVSKPPPKKRRTLSLTPPASSSHSHPPKFSNVTTNFNYVASANNTLTAHSSVNSDQESVWVILARALYSSGTSLSIVENPYWLEVFQRISPGLNLPSKESLCKELLDQETLKIQSEVEKQVAEAKYVSLQCEAWMNARGESMITFVVATPTPFSYKTFPTGGTHHSDTIIADCTSSTIRDIEATLSPSNQSTKVLAVVTTSKPHMKSAWTKIRAMYPDLLTFGCIVDGLELFLESILEQTQIAEILSVIRSVIIKIRHSPTIQSKYEQIQSQVMVDPSSNSDLRVGSGKFRKLLRLPRSRYWYRTCHRSTSTSSYLAFLVSLQSLLHSETTLRWLAGDAESLEMIGEDLGLFISDEFWSKIQILCKILFPTIKWLNCMKECLNSSINSNNSNGSSNSSNYCRPEISNVPKAFAEIQQALEENLSNSIWQSSVYSPLMESLDRQKENCLHSVHFAANLLDPREQCSCLNQDQVLQATEFIDNFAETYDLDSSAVIAELSEFRMKSGFYAKPFLWKVTKKVQSSIWWTTMAPKTHLAQLAAAVLNISPCSFSLDNVIAEASFSSSISSSVSTLSSSNAYRKSACSPATSSQERKLVYVAHNLRINYRGSLEDRRSARIRDHSEETLGDSGLVSGLLNSTSNSNGALPEVWNWSSLDSIPNYLESDSESEMDEDLDGEDEDHIIIAEQNLNQPQAQIPSSGGDPLKESYPDIKIISTGPTPNSFYSSS